MPVELTDIKHVGGCSECGKSISGAKWFWYVDGGAVHLLFCQDCGVPGNGWERICRATLVMLEDDRTGEKFARIIGIDEWFTDP